MSKFSSRPRPAPAPVLPPPPPPPPPPTEDTAAKTQEAENQRQIALKALGRQENIKTSQSGDTSVAPISIKKLTGQ